ncbi:hypothetical protein IGI04_015883 [Brassica rapa subsp. trilocularis]|uniref:Uncharacterized protein n=1 Tax=Brassica rapa subsp. trilocularis TaxID=1813537 RepID=A0ABQ7MTU2_BRACM|nr:hypothetical protein IGI04_015883 [Brassica rapa subsp. trilocularis]
MESDGLPEVDYFRPNSAGSCQRVESTGFILNVTELDWIQSLPLMFFLILFSHYSHHFSFNESHFAFDDASEVSVKKNEKNSQTERIDL